MRGGRPTIFLSCSGKYQSTVAEPIRNALGKLGIDAIIVAKERAPRNVNWDPDTKVDKYLEMSNAFVALATPDDLIDSGEWHPRQNIADEIARARMLAHLRNRSMVLKAPSVTLPSNIDPVHEPLSLEDPTAIVDVIVQQLRAWDVLAQDSASAVILADVAPVPSESEHQSAVAIREHVLRQLDGVRLGDWEMSGARAFEIVGKYRRAGVATIVETLVEIILDLDHDSDQVLPAIQLLECLFRLDFLTVPLELVEQMAADENFSVRASAATMLWDLTLMSPGEVPIGVLDRLARPADEDWYVQAPAMAAAKELLLVRPDVVRIFKRLATSEDAEDRSAAIRALQQVAKVAAEVVPRDLLQLLSNDEDDAVARLAREVSEAVSGVAKRSSNIRHFGI